MVCEKCKGGGDLGNGGPIIPCDACGGAGQLKRAGAMPGRSIPASTLFIDLETLPGDAVVGMSLECAPGWDPPMPVVEPRTVPSNYKDAAKIQAWHAKEAQRQMAEAHKLLEAQRAKDLKHWRDGAIRPADMRIACVGWTLGEGDAEVIDCAEDEAAGLKALAELVMDAKPARIVAHNGHGFDFPNTQLRAMRHHGLRLAAAFHQEKPWENRLVDTLAWWPGKFSKGGSLDACADLLGISREANPISGAEVLDAYVAGRWGDVVGHCLDDINVLREVYRVLREVRSD